MSLHVDRPDLPTGRPYGLPELEHGQPLSLDGEPLPVVRDPARPLNPERVISGAFVNCGVPAIISAVVQDRPQVAQAWAESLSGPQARMDMFEATEPTEDLPESYPTGRAVDLTLTPDLPVYRDDPTISAGVNVTLAEETWPGYAEKAAAGMPGVDGAPPLSTVPGETGYDRLEHLPNAGLIQLMAQYTGEPAYMGEVPTGDGAEQRMAAILDAHAGDPMIIGFGQPTEDPSGLVMDGEQLDTGLYVNHAYTRRGYDDGLVDLRDPRGNEVVDQLTPAELVETAARYGGYFITTFGDNPATGDAGGG